MIIHKRSWAKFGYKSEKKVEKVLGMNHHAIIFLSTCENPNCLNMAISKIILII